MRNQSDPLNSLPKALIYCRVSSVKQRVDGAGLQSQEHRCREYANQYGWDVEMVFPDDVSGAGDFMDRPGMRAMLAYLDAQKGPRYVVIFDDLKRFARDTEFHLKLRRELAFRGADVKCLNFDFQDTPEGRFFEVVMAASGQMEREQMARQNSQKSRARLENGYWVFTAPLGYKYVKDKGKGGKRLVKVEPVASVIREALEGYASGRFASQAEVQRFLESDPHFPKDMKNGTICPITVNRLLKQVVYSGYVVGAKWGISLRKGKHDGLISFETYQRVIDTIEGKKRRPAARADYNEDFPLRGHVVCDSCGNAMTGAWSSGCRKRYAYYFCVTRGCEAKSKSVPRAKFEDGFAEILRSLQPGSSLFSVAKVMLRDAWNIRLAEAKVKKSCLTKEVRKVEKQIEQFLERMLDVSNPTVVKRFEKKIDELERQRLVIKEQQEKTLPPAGRLEDCIELALKFLANPYLLYKKSDYAVRQALLRMVFSEPLRYSRIEGYRTPTLTFPFKVLAEISKEKCEVVLLEGIETLYVDVSKNLR
ncbi:recombinase family protein [Ruegeria arenilitoris]|uniref:recombinase family protein n=1 Tax=Ruegeria arenilitoris TaxID=1173585 RepID=UPI00147F79A7|nr:recombinase family protein [Ruegeria arenilitoris]